MQWLTVFIIYGVILGAALTDKLPMKVTDDTRYNLLKLPVVLVVIFGLYSIGVIACRVATFNDCEEDAKSLKQEIVEAREDLASKGFKFD